MIKYKYTIGKMIVTVEVEAMAQLFEYMEYTGNKRELDKENNSNDEEAPKSCAETRVYLNGVVSVSENSEDGTVDVEMINGDLVRKLTFYDDIITIEKSS